MRKADAGERRGRRIIVRSQNKEALMAQTIDDNAVPTIRGDEGATVLGPDNVAIAVQNPGPVTDSGSLPTSNFPSPPLTTVYWTAVGP